MAAPFSPDDSEAEVFRDFAMACRIERDRISLADLAEQDRLVDRAAIDEALADQFARRLIALICKA